MIDMVIVNSLVIYNEARVKQGEKKVTQEIFRLKLVEKLTRPWKDETDILVNTPHSSTCTPSPQASVSVTNSRPHPAIHLPMELETRKNCYAKYKVEHRAQLYL